MADTDDVVDKGSQMRVQMDPELQAWAKAKAARQYRSVSSVVREAVAAMRDAEAGAEEERP